MFQFSIYFIDKRVQIAYLCIVLIIQRHGTETGIKKKECCGKDTWHL